MLIDTLAESDLRWCHENILGSVSATNGVKVTRTLPRSLAGIVEDLELEQPRLVTLAALTELAQRHGLRSEPKVLAARLREHGWLLATGVRGVWEFAPGAHAGPHGHGDPLTVVHAIAHRYPNLPIAVAFGTAAWAHGYADRVPTRPEVAVPRGLNVPAVLTNLTRLSRFTPHLGLVLAKGAPVHRTETILVHLADRPTDVRSWSSVAEWLPELAADADPDRVTDELAGRPGTTRARLGYLLQALRPDISEPLRAAVGSKTWFGPRGTMRRHSQPWQIADTTLPFDPAALKPAIVPEPHTAAAKEPLGNTSSRSKS